MKSIKASQRSLNEIVTDVEDTQTHPRNITSSRAYANELGLLHPAPYLDVMTINTSHLVAPLRGDNRESHGLLLVEPISVAKLDHTGVTPTIFSKPEPLYYPNGTKRHLMRDNIANTIREVYSQQPPPPPPIHNLPWQSNTNVPFTKAKNNFQLDEKELKKVKQSLSPSQNSFIGPVPKKKNKQEAHSHHHHHLSKSLDGTNMYKSEEDVKKEKETLQLFKSLRNTNQLMERMGRIK